MASMSTSLASEGGVTVPPSSSSPRASRRLGFLIWAAFIVGFGVALIALARPRWFPILDLAQTEMRVRDVFTLHPPLIGLPGRIGTLARQGSHPGPLSFWVLAPFYKVFGSSAWALQAATACVNAIAIGLSLLIARRRGGTNVLLAVAAVLGALTYFYGPSVLTQAWNPYLPMLWFIVVALGVWSVLCDDLAMLPVATFAAVFCLQTHISYLGLVGGLGALAAVWLGWSLFRRRAALGPRPWRWILLALGIVALTSVPIIVQQITHTPGNLTIIWEHFTAPPETPIGIREGVKVLLVHLNPWRLLTGQDATTGTVVPGVILVAAWALGAVFALRARLRPVVALNVVIGVSLALGALSIANIFGFVWYYLMLWAWAITALMLFTTGWTVAALRGPRVGRDGRDAPRGSIGALSVALATITAAYLIGFGIDGSTVEPPTPRVSAALGVLVGPTVRAIDRGAGPGGGRTGRYQITIFDPVTINAPGYGLLSELERSGIHAGFPLKYAAIVRDRRVVTKKQATGVVHLSVGPDIAVWQAKPGAVEVATADLRTPAERREFQRLRRQTRRELIAAGRQDLVPNLDENIFTATFVDNLPDVTRQHLLRMLQIGEPSAVFLGPRSDAE
jgi:hypothetical protein